MGFERHFNETMVARIAAREKQMQQHFRPVIGVHKWFARRPGSLFRALALAELGSEGIDVSLTKGHELTGRCLDPFMGGGSPLFEAARLGLGVIGFDTNPMARWIVERELEDVDPEELRAAGERVCEDVELSIGRLYETSCPDCDGAALARYSGWVRHHRCTCGSVHPLLSDTKIVSTKLGRSEADIHLCPCCLELQRRPGDTPFGVCVSCGASESDGLVPAGAVQVCQCGTPYRIPPRGELAQPHHKMAFIEVDCPTCEGHGRRFKRPDEADLQRVAEATAMLVDLDSPYIPNGAIPPGRETARLLRWGHVSWRSLFGDRQLLGLHLLAVRINQEAEGPVRRALQTAFSDLLRFQNLLVRYDRQALKPTDVFAVHGFPVPRVACEPALLGVRGSGSGGFRHILAKYERAKSWCRSPYETVPENGRLRRYDTSPESVSARVVTHIDDLQSGDALLIRDSLSNHPLPPESADLVLTDPPYYANVQYAELMDFCYVWLRRLADAPYFGPLHTKTVEDAVAPRAGESELADFADKLSDVFVRAAEALKPGGMFAFTYHHNELGAYAPLVVACLDAGLRPSRLVACPSEMRASTHIRHRQAATLDAVFVLRKDDPSLDNSLLRPNASAAGLAGARLRAMKRAGLTPTEADRRCMRHSAESIVAMARLTDSWDRTPSIEDRLKQALSALGEATETTPSKATV